MGAPILLGGGSFEINRSDTVGGAATRDAKRMTLDIASGIATALRKKGFQAGAPTSSNRVDAGLQCTFGEGRYVDLGIVLEETGGAVSKFIVLPFGFRKKNDRELLEKLAEDWRVLVPIVNQVVTNDFGAEPVRWLSLNEVDARCASMRPK